LDQINAKLDEGYILIPENSIVLNNPVISFENKNSLEKCKRESKEEIISNVKIGMPQYMWELIDEINKKANELEVFYEPELDYIIASGQANSLDQLVQFIDGLCVARKFEEAKDNENRNEEKNDVLIQKELNLPNEIRHLIEEIENKASELKIIYENLDDKLLIAGLETAISEFLVWMYNLVIKCLQEETKKSKEQNLRESSDLNYDDEINISTFHRAKKDDIKQKMNELKLRYRFGYDTILATGTLGTIKELKSYLYDIEAITKKSLYPKYWDFHEEKAFSEIRVQPSSEEFFEVSSLFHNSINNVNITKITRIQNRYLMDHYVTMLQKRKELRPNMEMNRQLLFHGTRVVDPKNIYEKSDVGFDIQYSKPSGSYGKGLYFAIHASYTHNGYGYASNSNSFKMILADVFVGKAYLKGPDSTLVKPPVGYDSVRSNQNFYIIYNNFHSYPLYLIEYKNQKNVNYKSLNMAQTYVKNNVNIVNYRQTCIQQSISVHVDGKNILGNDSSKNSLKKKKSLLQKLFSKRKNL